LFLPLTLPPVQKCWPTNPNHHSRKDKDDESVDNWDNNFEVLGIFQPIEQSHSQPEGVDLF
jgi:hypothetical protein